MSNRFNEITRSKMGVLTIGAMICLGALMVSLSLTPSSAEESSFILKLLPEENRIKYVNATEDPDITFSMALYNGDGEQAEGTHTITLEVDEIVYSGGSNYENWEFEFVNAHTGTNGTYYVDAEENVTVTLKVAFLGNNGGEMVTFTILGTDEEENSTHLSPYRGLHSNFEFLTVASAAEYNPFFEPASSGDRREHILPVENIYSIVLWNLGVKDDIISLASWEVWQDVNSDGKINSADVRSDNDIRNENFNLNFSTSTGGKYELHNQIPLKSGDSEQLVIKVIPELNNDLIPVDSYLIRLIIYSHGGKIFHMDSLKGYMSKIDLPDYSIIELELPEKDIEKGEIVKIEAEIGFTWIYPGEVTYKFYLDGKELPGGGTIKFSSGETSRKVSITWKAEKADEGEVRTIGIKVDPENSIRESDERNNEMSGDVKVVDKNGEFPLWIKASMIATAVVMTMIFLFWFIQTYDDLRIENIRILPEKPKIDDDAVITVEIKNYGSTINTQKQRIFISFYEDFEIIQQKQLDLGSREFGKDESHEVSIDWIPAESGMHSINIAVDVNDEEFDVSAIDIKVLPKEHGNESY